MPHDVLLMGDDLESAVAAFERQRGADLAEFLPEQSHPNYLRVLTELVRVDMEFAWDGGDERRLEHYVRRFPGLLDDADAFQSIAEEEVRLRRGAGEVPQPDEFTRRFGRSVFSDALNETVVEHPVLDRLPRTGEVVCGFEIVEEIGVGAFGRVYEARQVDLAGRVVALKISTKRPGESRILARLQHTHIVPVYSVHRYGLYHVVCMPLLGRTTFADLIATNTLQSTAVLPAGPTVAESVGEPITRTEPAMRHPPAVNVARVLKWGVRVADALHHAHSRGILHRDIKPANILLAEDNQPLLLDFNLAEETDAPDGVLGGTIAYMAPEQRAALHAGRGTVDARADLYSLGVVLYEVLTGHRVTSGESKARLRNASGLSPATQAIFQRLLAADPARRYQSAAELKDDLQRQLDDRPLKHAPNPSLRERFRKWLRRHPRLSSSLSLGTLAAVIVLSLATLLLQRQLEIRRVETANAVQTLVHNRETIRGLLADRAGPTAQIEEAVALAHSSLQPFQGEALPLSEADRARVEDAMRDVRFDQTRGHLWLVERQPTERMAQLAAVWEDHERLWAGEPQPRAELVAQRAYLLHALGRADEAERLAQQLLAPGREDQRTTQEESVRYLQSVYAAEAGRPAFWLRLGRLLAGLGRHDEARAHLRVAAGLDPRSPWPPFHEGVVSLNQHDDAAAEHAFGRVLELAPGLPEAMVNRALARYRLKKHAEALADLDRLESRGLATCRAQFIRELVLRDKGDSAGVLAAQKAGLARQPRDAEDWCSRGEARLRATPVDAAAALADFVQATHLDPRLREAWMNRAHVLGEHLNRPVDAIAVLDQVANEFPEHILARSSRGVYLARVGKVDKARADADAVAAIPAPALAYYQAACVYALTAQTDEDVSRSLGLLRRTLKAEPHWMTSMATDADLKTLHNHKAFKNLLDAATVMILQ